ncbi:TRPM8 channel-associated factor homolog [Mantella aurantiaca]
MFIGNMTAKEDYSSLVRGLHSLEFSGDSVPCQLLLTGDTAYPVLVTPAQHVLLAASKYGKGKIVVMSHESYLSQPQFMDFLKNAISWLKPSLKATIGVNDTLGDLEKSLSSSGHRVEKVSGLKKDLGVFCTIGYDDSQAQDIVTFLREGGGVLIGAQAWHWSQSHKQENVLLHFPGNKITSVAGIYFTDKYGEKGKFCVSKNIPWSPMQTDIGFSADLKHLMQDVSDLNISGECVPSELFLHGPLTFPVGLSKNNQCFFGAAYYGRGRVVVGTHESYLSKPELEAFILNAVSWLDVGRNGKIGVKHLEDHLKILQKKGLPCVASDLTPGLSVYCCTSYSDAEAEKIQQFVAEGGGLLIAGHAWYWSYSNPNVLSQYPGNKILNKFGLSILAQTVEQGVYKALDPKAVDSTYNFSRAVCQLLRDSKSGIELNKPLSYWLAKFREDVSSYMKLPASPLTSSLQQELVHLVQGCRLPVVSKQCPVKNDSKEAFIMCLAQELSCLECLDDHCEGDIDLLDQHRVTVQIDATNPGGDAWRSTGLYLPPGKTAVVMFPASAARKGLQVQVGCHSDNLSAAKEFCRAPVVVHKKDVCGEKVKISCVWGGLVYIIVKEKSHLGLIPVTVYGAEPAPTFINGQTSRTSWLQTIRNYPAPWAELITDNIILTVPSEAIRSLEDPEALMSLWDKVMAAVADLAAVPKKFPRPERIVTDVQISAGWMHSGYPIMCHLESATEITNVEHIKKNGFWGPIHELGHNEQRGVWEFPPHTTEATCNLWSVYVHETVLQIPRDQAHPDLKPKDRETRIQQYLKSGAKLAQWSVWTALETYLQLQEGFGWDPFKRLFAEYQTLSYVGNNADKMNLWAEKFSLAVHRNLSSFFKSWGWPIEETTSQKLSDLPMWKEDPMKKYTNSK